MVSQDASIASDGNASDGFASQALSHLKILDLSRILAGPWTAQLLGDLGAEVIKVERPESGDDTRGWGPPYLAGTDKKHSPESAYYLSTNRNKRSITVDITTPEGQDIIRRLAQASDVLIENYKVGGLKAYGLDYESIQKVNPRLVYCSITGFGQTGPYAPRPGYDLLIQAMGGMMSITGDKAGAAGAGPQKVGVAVVDILTGLYAATGILAALAHRDRTGEGQHIDLALLDVEVACLANQGMNYLVSGIAPERLGNAHPNIVPYQDFETADGSMIIAVGNDSQFVRLCEAIGLEALAKEPRYATNRDRVANRDRLVREIAGHLKTRPAREWVSLIQAAGVPCGPINTIADVFKDPQVIARGMQRSMESLSANPVPLISNPLNLSVTPVRYRLPPPKLGEANAQILGERLGISTAELEALARRKAI